MATHAGSERSEAQVQAQVGAGPHGPASHGSHHGNSVAAWTMVIIVALGSLVGAVGICIPSITVIVVGAVIVVIGLIAGKLLSLAGYGTVKPADEEASHGVG
ncbi:MAG TPA: HGxxPAAW family protein [Actinomycetales bacterium]|nr:HGxxPAAW family protein [Actinomycetales bacterium]